MKIKLDQCDPKLRERIERQMAKENPSLNALTSCQTNYVTAPAAVEIESELHNEIIRHCRQWGWQYLHGSMAHKTRRVEGEPDFVLIASRGRVFFIECKSRTGKLSPAQVAFVHHAFNNGHTVNIVRSMAEFIEVVSPV